MIEPPAGLTALSEEAGRLGVELDARALGRFARYLELLLEWTPRAGLTAVTDPEQVQRRHFGESLALLVALRNAGLLDAAGASVIDIGAGAGLPALPMCIAEPALCPTLLEASARRCRFLERVVGELGLERGEVVCARAEDAGRNPALRGRSDLAVARAVAPLAVLVEYALPLLRRGGLLAVPKGSRAGVELAEAAAAIAALGGRAEPSLTLSLPTGAPPQQVLLVRRVGDLDDRYPRRPGIPSKRPLR